MTEKEIAELRRRFRPEKSNIRRVRGCYVNAQGEIVSQFTQSMALTPQEETEKILALLRKTLTGSAGKNLIDISFATQQVAGSEEHGLLMELRSSALENEAAVQAFLHKVIEAASMEEPYLILLAYDTYDVPYRSKDAVSQADASSEVFSYILCSICPVKTTKPALCYDVPENIFHNQKLDWIVSPPELGFLFPAFDGRSANIYGALYFTKDIAQNHKEFADAVFCTELPMPAAEQKEAFQSFLNETLEEDCSYEMVQAVREQLSERIEEHKNSGEEEPLIISKREVRRILEECGASETHMSSFDEKFDENFGSEADIHPRNVIDPKQMEIKTPSVTIRIRSERSDLVETRILNGARYILIRADEGVEVNGIPVQIS